MSEIVVIGENEFTVGFQLAGINRVIELDKDIEEKVASILNDEDVGIIITSPKTVDALSERIKNKLFKVVKPVTVVVSHEEKEENLRKMIIKSIGVDLWEK